MCRLDPLRQSLKQAMHRKMAPLELGYRGLEQNLQSLKTVAPISLPHQLASQLIPHSGNLDPPKCLQAAAPLLSINRLFDQ